MVFVVVVVVVCFSLLLVLPGSYERDALCGRCCGEEGQGIITEKGILGLVVHILGSCGEQGEGIERLGGVGVVMLGCWVVWEENWGWQGKYNK